MFESSEVTSISGSLEDTARQVPCVTPASFWAPQHIVESAWLEHAPFAFWLMQAVRPRMLVELGTHAGFSFLTFCQAVQQLGLPTKCYAADTWQGDEHAGFYGEHVYHKLCAIQGRHYGGFSRLIRARFDEALQHFADGEIDLLHVDGRHCYEDVVEDYSTWLPKLSERAVVLFHDTNVRERDFGVWRFWAELREKHPSFEFVHGHGLGVLCPKSIVPDGLRSLFESAPNQHAVIRQVYSRLGAAISTQYQLERTHSEILARDSTIAQLQQQSATGEEERNRLLAELITLRSEIASADHELNRCNASAAKPCDDIAVRDKERDALSAELAAARDELAFIKASTMWRASGVVRLIGSRLPMPVRRQIRRGIKVLWWAITPHRMPQRIRFLRARKATVISE